MKIKDLSKAPGHWVLASMGKRVLRPGGVELTTKLIDALNINKNDHVIEFAPGLGATAKITLAKHPKSYTGIEGDEQVAGKLRKKINANHCKIIASDAVESGLSDECASKIYGEAVLTMLADHRKSELMREARRMLCKGGLYAIHEIELCPENISSEEKAKIQKDLARAIRVNARPLTRTEWINLLESENFKIKCIENNPMHLLKTTRILSDEGLIRTLKIGFNIFSHPVALKRILEMRSVFNRYANHMQSIMIVAEKQ
jgi:phospholipid N-methyltransferase